MDDRQTDFFNKLPISFGGGFLKDHAGSIIDDTGVAVIELIANCYDAGATEVNITWPDGYGLFSIEDNGTGMTHEEFESRWKQLKYNRLIDQGKDVKFPPGVKRKGRVAFGQGGKGRHGAFAFADSYEVRTSKEGKTTLAKVSLNEDGSEPFKFEITDVQDGGTHGTKIFAEVTKSLLDLEEVSELVGSKFAVDPEFVIKINGNAITLASLQDVQTASLEIDGIGKIQIHCMEASQNERKTRFRGITWWVNKRMVGNSSWSGLDDQGSILDGRKSAAKKYSFIIEADFLKESVKTNWSGFHDNKESVETKKAVKEYVIKKLYELMAGNHKERKIKTIQENREIIKELPSISRKVVGTFIDEIQEKCPSLSDTDLSKTVKILANLEESRHGYNLIDKLSTCSPEDLDTWDRVMEEWTASNAEVILQELGERIKLIQDLEKLVDSEATDELHDLHPLFVRGLWMFGPEYESADFTSNRGMMTVLNGMLGGSEEEVSRKRPDLVALPDKTISIHSADSYDDEGVVNGLRNVLIIELKRGKFPLTIKEVRQTEDYCEELLNSKLVQENTRFTAYVLGATLENVRGRTIDDRIKIKPFPFSLILRQAHARTFNLQQKIKEIYPTENSDQEIQEVLSDKIQGELALDC